MRKSADENSRRDFMTTAGAATGLAALTHAVEAYLSKPATPITDTNALKAVQLILGAVEGAFTDIENNHCDRENLMYGSTIAGFAFGKECCGGV